MEPTKEELKRFWEWCGFKLIDKKPFPTWWYGNEYAGNEPPSVSLNTLFRWAVPKLDKPQIAIRQSILPEHYEEWYCLLEYVIDSSSRRKLGYDKDPALALFWAINKVISGDYGRKSKTRDRKGD